MDDELLRLIRAGMTPPGSPAGIAFDAAWRPPADLYRGRTGWLAKFEIAGVRADDLEIEFVGRRLVVRGVRRDAVINEAKQSHSLEISYSRFQRIIELPEDVARAQLTTEYRDGMLLVRITPSADAE